MFQFFTSSVGNQFMRNLFLLGAAVCLGGVDAKAQSPVCSPEGSCLCGGNLPLTCGGGGSSSCPPGQTQRCTPTPTAYCLSNPALTCYGSPVGNNAGCLSTIWMNQGPTHGVVSYLPGTNQTNIAACAHGEVWNCLVDSASAANAALGTAHQMHVLRDCLIGHTAFNTPMSPLGYSQAGYPYIVVNDQCQFVGTVMNPSELGGQNCGGINVSVNGSPISLILEDGYDIEANLAIVPFAVNPGEKEKFFTWKASAKSPLLVFDPEHTGNITSSSQLFGNWTFGGKKLASIVYGGQSTAWRDGYEALGILDANRDQKIAGDELKPLALWLDANQNGISESGEVQSLAQHGIKEIYYSPDSKDETTKSIFASKGYLRSVNGADQIGRSVDWYSSTAGDINTFMQNIVSNAISPAGSAKAESVKTDSPTGAGEIVAGAKNSSASVSGRWRWSSKNAPDVGQADRAQGYLYIGDNGDGKIVMVSVNYVRVTTESLPGAKTGMRFFLMTGTKTTASDGSTIINFESTDDGSPAKHKSIAVLQGDGASLEGETSASGSLKGGKSTSVKYQWTALREDS